MHMLYWVHTQAEEDQMQTTHPTEIKMAINWLGRQTYPTVYLAEQALARYGVSALTPEELIDLTRP